jgi:hypothetical protein
VLATELLADINTRKALLHLVALIRKNLHVCDSHRVVLLSILPEGISFVSTANHEAVVLIEVLEKDSSKSCIVY